MLNNTFVVICNLDISTLPETNITAENRPKRPKWKFHLPTIDFQVQTVRVEPTLRLSFISQILPTSQFAPQGR